MILGTGVGWTKIALDEDSGGNCIHTRCPACGNDEFCTMVGASRAWIFFLFQPVFPLDRIRADYRCIRHMEPEVFSTVPEKKGMDLVWKKINSGFETTMGPPRAYFVAYKRYFWVYRKGAFICSVIGLAVGLALGSGVAFVLSYLGVGGFWLPALGFPLLAAAGWIMGVRKYVRNAAYHPSRDELINDDLENSVFTRKSQKK